MATPGFPDFPSSAQLRWNAIRARIFEAYCVVLFAVVAVLATLTPEPAFALPPPQEAARLVGEMRKGNKKGVEEKLLALMISYPREDVFIEAARWPWTGFGGHTIKNFLKPWVLRSPKLRQVFKEGIESPDKEIRAVAIEVLAPLLKDDAQLHAQVTALAKNGDNHEALNAIEPFVESNAADREAVVELAKEGLAGKGNIYGAFQAMRKHLDSVPEFAEAMLTVLRNSSDLWRLEIAVSTCRYELARSPRLREPFRGLLTTLRSGQKNEIEIRYIVLASLLDVEPQNPDLLGTLAELIVHLVNEGDLTWDNAKVIDLARHYLGRSESIDEAIDRSLSVLALRALAKPQHFANAPDIGPFLDAYIHLHRGALSFDVQKVHTLIQTVPSEVARDLYTQIIVRSALLPRSAEPLINEAIASVDSVKVAANIYPYELPPRAALEVAWRDLNSGSKPTVERAAEILSVAARVEPQYAEKLREMARTGPDWKHAIAIKALKSIALNFPEVWSPSPPDSMKATLGSQRRLLAYPDAPMGWRQVVQGYASMFDSDPLLLTDAMDPSLAGNASDSAAAPCLPTFQVPPG